MKHIIVFAIVLIALPLMANAQTISVTFEWDSPSAPGPADNPVKHKLYRTPTEPIGGAIPADAIAADVGTSLSGVLQISRGRVYVFVTAYNYALQNGGVIVEDPQFLQESGISNVLRLDVTIPPGNPSNFKIRTAVVGESRNGQIILYKQAE